jgi:hypothetical protein
MTILDRVDLSSQPNAPLSRYVALLHDLITQNYDTIAKSTNPRLTTQEKYMSRMSRRTC